jgi:hypothetical protein
LVTSSVSLGAAIINHNCTQALVTACILGICGGIAALASQDAAEGAKAHAESQTQIAELQLRSNLAPNAIDSGDTSQLRRVPMTPAAAPPPVVPPTSPVATNPTLP